jgi:hypothetical protein
MRKQEKRWHKRVRIKKKGRKREEINKGYRGKEEEAMMACAKKNSMKEYEKEDEIYIIKEKEKRELIKRRNE